MTNTSRAETNTAAFDGIAEVALTPPEVNVEIWQASTGACLVPTRD